MPNNLRALLVACSVAVVPAAHPVEILAQTPAGQVFAGTERSNGPAAGSNSLSRIFTDTVDDFRRLPSVETATILSIGAMSAVLGERFDDQATMGLSSSRELGTVFSRGESIGSARAQAVAAVATYAIGRVTSHPRVTAVGADLISAQIVTQLTTSAIKMSVGRTRPDGTDFSFPSGHSSTAFATATVLQRHLGWKVGLAAYGAATYVAASRIQAKRHFLSDVAFGAAVGIVAGRTVTFGRGDTTFALAPAAVPGGGAVNVTWVGRK